MVVGGTILADRRQAARGNKTIHKSCSEHGDLFREAPAAKQQKGEGGKGRGRNSNGRSLQARAWDIPENGGELKICSSGIRKKRGA